MKPEPRVVVAAEQITKVFGGTVALDGVDFAARAGEVSVLIGENGAGKSTLMKILAGVEAPTSGRLLLDGEEVAFDSPREAFAHGIGIIYQELNLFPNLNVTENIFMAREVTHGGIRVDAREQRRRAKALIDRLQQPIDPGTLVEELPLGQQQIVEIAKVLAQDCRVLIMDEPTSALSNAEADVLFRVIDELKAAGVTIIYISHKLEELLEIGDQLTVLRDGKLVESARAADVDIPWIVERMVGRRLGALTAREHGEPNKHGPEVLSVQHLWVQHASDGVSLEDVSLSVHAGEIVGLYGLRGAGRTELLETLAGLNSATDGEVLLEGVPLGKLSPEQRMARGLVLVPEDRQAAGLVQTMSVADNITLAALWSVVGRLGLSRRIERRKVDEAVRDLTIKTADPRQSITALSGGNQQKVVLAKALLTKPHVVLLDEPTRGIDVGAKAEIFELMSRLASNGMGVLFASSELNEVLAVSDRVVVMSKGRITAEYAGAEATEHALVDAAAVGHRPLRAAA